MHTQKTRFETVGLFAIACVAALAMLRIVLGFNINWDEFNFLSKVHAYSNGTLEVPLQTFHVHAFGWLKAVSANEADQVIAARLVMLLLLACAAVFVYRIAARVTDRPSALFAALAYVSLTYVIRGGASFRYDPIAIALIMAALDLVMLRPPSRSRAAGAGLLFATAGMVTIKSAILLPTFLLLLALPQENGYRRESVVAALTGIVAAAAGFAGLYSMHDLSLADAATAEQAKDAAASGFAKTIAEAGIFPRLSTFLTTLRVDFGIWVFLLAGGVVTVMRLMRSRGAETRKWLAVVALAAPLGSLLFYRNAFPYFYAFLMAPPAVLLAVAWNALQHLKFAGQTVLGAPVVKTVMGLHLLFNLSLQGFTAPQSKPLSHQRKTLAEIHRMFPEPVAYFDRGNFVASFPQAGFFMSTWGMDDYRAAREPVFAKAIAEATPPLLIADHPLLDPENQIYPPGANYGHSLFAADRAALADAYIHHWGPIYVAGVKSEVSGRALIQIPISGRYTLEAERPVMIDGAVVSPGKTVILEQGEHEISVVAKRLAVTLRWGKRLHMPDRSPPELPLFLGF